MIKRFLLFTAISCFAMVATASNELQTAILQHGEQTTVFNGSTALTSAYEASVDGDVITLSAGTFSSVDIKKSITIYGAGYENIDDEGIHLTKIGGFTIRGENDTLRNVHIEGLYVNGGIVLGANNQYGLRGIKIVKCFSTGIRFVTESHNCIIDQCVVNGDLYGENGGVKLADNLIVSNTIVTSSLRDFATQSTILVDHCMLRNQIGKYNSTTAFLWTNCIFYNNGRACWDDDYRMVSAASVVRNCIHVQEGTYGYNGFRDVDMEGCWLVPLSEIFADAADGTYTPERTYALQQPDVWVGTDGTQVGINGGHGWSRAPGIPTVKSLTLTVDGVQLKVDYEAEAR